VADEKDSKNFCVKGNPSICTFYKQIELKCEYFRATPNKNKCADHRNGDVCTSIDAINGAKK